MSHAATSLTSKTDIAFRSAMRVTAASVSLLTCRDSNGGLHGSSVSSFAPLSMDPPAMMVAIARTGPAYPAMLETGSFCLNFLAESHSEFVDLFAGKENLASWLGSNEWKSGPNGAPYLESALANVFCDDLRWHHYENQTVFFGSVTQAYSDPEDERLPLIWLHGAPLHLPTSKYGLPS